MKVSEGGSHLERYIWMTLSLKEAIELQKILSASIYNVSNNKREAIGKMNYRDDSGYPDYLNDFELTVLP